MTCGPDDRVGAPIDEVSAGVRAAVPGVSVRDDNVWFIERNSNGFEVQLNVGERAGVANDGVLPGRRHHGEVCMGPQRRRGRLVTSIGVGGMLRGGVAVVVASVLLVVAACGGDLRQVSAASSDVVGSWRGSDGTRVTFRADGTFDADHWPDLFGAAVTYGRDSGKWEVSHEDGFEYNVVQLTYPELSGDHDLPAEIAVVQLKGKPGVCIERDPDDICGAGVLMRS